MSGLVPINTNAHSSVEIDGSCNDCCSCCWPRRVRREPRALERDPKKIYVTPTSVKVHSASMPEFTKSAEDEWVLTIDGKEQQLENPTISMPDLSGYKNE